MTDPCNPHYLAAHRATENVYNIEPDYTRGGGSIPVTLTLQVCCFLIILFVFILYWKTNLITF